MTEVLCGHTPGGRRKKSKVIAKRLKIERASVYRLLA
jgi:hypothetical protein